MRCFEDTQLNAIQMVSILWKMAFEYSSDDTYGDVRELMEDVILAECTTGLAEAMGGFDELRHQTEADAKERLFYIEHGWKMNFEGGAK